MPCSKRGHSGDLEYKQIIASPAGKVNPLKSLWANFRLTAFSLLGGISAAFGLRPNLPPSLNSVRFDNSIQYQT